MSRKALARFCATELALLGGGYALYAAIRDREGHINPVSKAKALRDAQDVLSVERVLRLDQEATIQHVATQFPWLIRALDTFWSYGYLIVTVGVLLWLLAKRPDRYRELRRVFVVTTVAALVVFAVFPTVPPRLLPAHYGIIDTWSKFGGIAAHTPPRIERIADPFAAMPSLHVAWSVWCVVVVISLRAPQTRRWLAWTALAYPALTIACVVISGNHYVLDCLAGAGLVGAASLATRGWSALFQRRRASIDLRPVGVALPLADQPPLLDPLPVGIDGPESVNAR